MSRVALVAVLAALAAAAPAGAAPPTHAPRQVVVRFAAGASAHQRAAARASVRAHVGRTLALRGAQLLVLPRRASVARAVRTLERRAGVRYAEPNQYATSQSCPVDLTRGLCLPDDPGFGQQWGMNNTGQSVNGNGGTVRDSDVDAAEAWSVTRGSDSVVVAVVDSGIAYDNPDLADRIWHNPGEAGAKASNGVDDDRNGYVDDWQGWDVVGDRILDPDDSDNDPRDISGHGTHVAGIIGATGSNGRGVTGLNWNVRLMNVRVRAERSNETSADIADAFVYAARNGAQVVNVSLAETQYSQYLADTIERFPTVLFVIAAGNLGLQLDAPGAESFPCEYPAANIVCVAATGRADELAAFSNYSPVSVDIGAPGTITLSSAPSYTTLQTDSFESDPFATGRWIRGASAGTNQWDRSTTNHGGGSHSLASHAQGADEAGSDTWIQSVQPLSLAGQKGCEVATLVWADTDPGSGLYLQARADQSFMPASRSPSQDTPTPSNDTVSYFSGSTAARRLRVNISDLDGRPAVYFRYGVLASAEAPSTHPRAFIDDMRVRCLGSAYSANGMTETDFLQGTSMATPHVAGTAALVLAAHPGLTAGQLKAILLASVDPLPSLAGKVLSGGRVNAYKAVAWTDIASRDGTMTVSSDEGERNHVSMAYDVDAAGVVRYHVRDPWTTDQDPAGGSRISPGPRCESIADTDGACFAYGVGAVRVDLGDLDDTVDLVDGVAETVDCGPGLDVATLEAADTAANCEKVTRKTGPAAPPPSANPFPPPPPGAAGDTTKPRLRIAKGNRTRRLTRKGALRLTIGPADEAVSGAVTIRTVRKLGRGKAGKRRRLTFGRKRFALPAGKRVTVVLRLSRAERRLVRRRHAVRLRATFAFADAAGNAVTKLYVFTLRPRTGRSG